MPARPAGRSDGSRRGRSGHPQKLIIAQASRERTIRNTGNGSISLQEDVSHAHEQQPFQHESFQDCESIVRYTRALHEGFENGPCSWYFRWETHELKPQGMTAWKSKPR